MDRPFRSDSRAPRPESPACLRDAMPTGSVFARSFHKFGGPLVLVGVWRHGAPVMASRRRRPLSVSRGRAPGPIRFSLSALAHAAACQRTLRPHPARVSAWSLVLVVFANLEVALASNDAGVSCLLRLPRGRRFPKAPNIANFQGRGGPGVDWRGPPRRTIPIGPIFARFQGLRCHFAV